MWKTQFNKAGAMDLSLIDLFLLRHSNCIYMMNRLTGDIICDIACQCVHKVCHIRGNPTDKDSILESCSQCEVIRSYDVNSESCKTICTGFKSARICIGPSGSVLALDRWLKLLQFEWNQVWKTLRLVNNQKISHNFVDADTRGILKPERICYMEQNDILVFTTKKFNGDNLEPFDVRAMKLSEIWSEETAVCWKLSGVMKPDKLAFDNDGHIYVSDIETRNIFVIDGSNGNPLKVLLPQEGTGTIHTMRWSKSQPHLTVYHNRNVVSCYSVQ